MDKLKEIFIWWNYFDRKEIIIKSENKTFDIIVQKESLPHLLGLHYSQRDKRIIPSKMIKDILNDKITYDDIIDKVRDKNRNMLRSVRKRIDTFKEFMENIENTYIVENTYSSTNIKSEYLAINDEDGNIKQLAILTTEGLDNFSGYNISEDASILETYIVNKGDKYYKDTTIKEPVKALLFYDEKVDMLRAGSFDLEKDRRYEDEALYKFLDEKLHREVNRENEVIEKTEKEIFSFSKDDKEIEL